MQRELKRAVKAVALETLNAAHRPGASRSFKRAVDAEKGQARVAIGGGPISIPGWINTDIDFRADHYLDLMKPWPVPAGAVANVYGDNVIEHFPLAAGRTVLRNIFAALAPGGAVRLSTPDVGRVAEGYLAKSELALRHLDRHREHGYTVYHPVDLLRVTYTEAEHYLGYCFDFETLAHEMREAGFVDVHREEAGESAVDAFQGLEARVSETERAFMLVIEGRRPT